MGVSYSATKLKVQLKSATARMTMSINKRSNAIRIDSRLIGSLLQQHKDESARIKVEGLLHQRNLVSVMETLQLMCDLLATRIQIISHSTEPLADLEEAIATLIYASQRVEISELELIAQQLGAKYGEKPMRAHLDNASGKVNPRVVEKLQIHTPDFALIISTMQQIANEWGVEWKPDLSVLDSGMRGADPERLGAIAGGPKPATESEYKEEDLQALPVASRGGKAAQSPPPAGSPGGSAAGGGEGGGVAAVGVAPRVDERKEVERKVMDPPQRGKSPMSVEPSPDMNVSFSNSTLASVAPQPSRTLSPSPVPAAAPPVFAAQMSSPSNVASYPGTLNIILLQGRELPQATSTLAKTVVRISDPTAPSWHWQSLPAFPSPSPSPTLFPVGQHCPLSISSPTQLIVVEVIHQYGKDVGDEVVGGLSIEAEQMRRSGASTAYTIFSPQSHAPRGQVLLASQWMALLTGVEVGGSSEPIYHLPSPQQPPSVEGAPPPAYDNSEEGELAQPLIREEAAARAPNSHNAARGSQADADLQARFSQLG